MEKKLRIANAIRNNEGEGFDGDGERGFPSHSEQELMSATVRAAELTSTGVSRLRHLVSDASLIRLNSPVRVVKVHASLCKPRSKKKCNHFTDRPVGNSYVKAYLSSLWAQDLKVE